MPEVRFGFTLPLPAERGVRGLLEDAALYDSLGFDYAWMPDHLLMMPPGPTPDAWSVLAAAAVVTTRVRLGTAVSDIHRLHPAVLAQKAATLDHLSGGRAVVGLGAGEAMNLDPFGIERGGSVLRKMREYVEVLRGLWRGGELTYEGEFFRLRRAFLQLRPLRGGVPVYVAANAPRMRFLAGMLADGWLPTRETPETYRRHLRDVEEGARKAGRSLDEIDRCLLVATAVADEYDEAIRALMTGDVRCMFAVWPRKVEEAGFRLGLPPDEYPPDYYSSPKCVPTEEGVRAFRRLGAYVTEEVVRAFSICGTPDDAIGRIEEYVRAGVTNFVLVNAGPDKAKVLEAYSRRIIPYFRDLER